MARQDGRKRVTKMTRQRSQQLKSDSTFPEQLLWSVLRGKQMGGLRFRRQHPVEPYILDFYCTAARLAIELDGESHDGRERHDENRTYRLEQQGIRVLRVANDDVLTNLEGVVDLIARAVGVGTAECGREERIGGD